MKSTITFICLLLFVFTSKATHNRAGEILYKRIAPFTSVVGSTTVQVYTYSITVVKYTDHGSAIADRCMDTVYFGDGQKGAALRVNGIVSATCNCNAIPCGSIILNNPGYIVKKSEYSIIHTYAGPGNYVVRSVDPNRNGGIHNIPNSINIEFEIQSIIVISATTGANSSPVLTIAPIDQATLNTCFSHNPGATDADGDSLSFQITPCMAPGYFYPEIVVPGGTYSIHPSGGILTWCNPLFLAEYNVAIIIKEWRKNSSGLYQFNGQVMRDMQILVKYGVVGLSEEENKMEFESFPNPVSSQLKIKLGSEALEKVECVILNSSGTIVFTKKESSGAKELNLDLSELSSGIYLLRLNTNGKTSSKKIVKE